MHQLQVHLAVAAHSGFGHTRRQAEAVARGAAGVPRVAAHLLDVANLSDAEWATLDRADAIIFGAPTYMGSPSAAFKAFAEETSKAWGDGWTPRSTSGASRGRWSRNGRATIAAPRHSSANASTLLSRRSTRCRACCATSIS